MSREKEDIHLCQVNETLSCGACCGLYNLPDPSASVLSDILARRTVLFAGVHRDMKAILEFGENETARTGPPPLADFHHCPYLGLIGPEKSRVGCLLHPLGEGNGGVDYRGLSHYGSMTCQVYFCATHRRIPPYLKMLMCNIINDWHTFGLMAPETDLLEAMDQELRKRISTEAAEMIDLEKALEGKNRVHWQTLLNLKQYWPYRAQDRPWGNYFFNDGLHGKPPVNYEKTGKTGSRYDRLFRELHTAFESPEELYHAEDFLDRLLNDLAAGLDP
jgi:hypothetical protein